MRLPSHAPSGPPRLRGFVRHDLFLLAALVLVALAVVVPQAVRHGLKGALLALLGVAGVLAAGILALLALTWLVDQANRGTSGWRSAAVRGLAHLLRFVLFGFIVAVVAEGLLAFHGLGPRVENLVFLGALAAGGTGGCLLHARLGPDRFWTFFRWLCLALACSLFGGLLGILGPGNWGVDLGILTPLVTFALVLAVRGISVSSPPRVP